MKLEDIDFAVNWDNKFMMGEKTKSVGVFKETPRDVSKDILKLFVCMAIYHQDKLVYTYTDGNRSFDIKVEVIETTKNNNK